MQGEPRQAPAGTKQQGHEDELRFFLLLNSISTLSFSGEKGVLDMLSGHYLE
jgi:hypothetical protein